MSDRLSVMTDPERCPPSRPAAPSFPPPLLHPSSARPSPASLGAAQQNTITLEPLTKAQEKFLDEALGLSDDSETECQIVKQIPPKKKSLKQRLDEKEREIIAYQNMVITARAECSIMTSRAKKAEEQLAALGSDASRLFNTTCRVCFTRVIDIRFSPCFHNVACNVCYRQLHESKCPLCRQEITGTERVYWN